MNGEWYWRPADPIEYVATGDSVENGDGAPLTVPFPDGIEDGDFLLVLWHSRQAGRRQTWPEGWTTLFGDNNAPGTSIEFGYKFYATGDSEPEIVSTTNETADNPIAQMVAFRYVDQFAPFADRGAVTNFLTGATTVSDVEAPPNRFDGNLVIAAVNWRANRTCSATASQGDTLTWGEIGHRTSVEASQGGFRWDYAISPEETAPEITDKDYTLSGDGSGGKAVIFTLAQAPRPGEVNEVLQEDLADDPNPVNLWHNLSSTDPNEDETNWQITVETDDPSPFIPIGRDAPTGQYRRCRLDDYVLASPYTLGDTTVSCTDVPVGTPTTAGVLNIGATTLTNGVRLLYDALDGNDFTGVTVPDGETGTVYPAGTRVAHVSLSDIDIEPQDHYRAQCIAGSATNSFYVYSYGELLTTFYSFRFDTNIEDPDILDEEKSQIIQWKATASHVSPLLSLQEESATINVRYNATGSAGINLGDIDKPIGAEWMRVGIRILFHPTAGSIEIFTKYSEPGEWENPINRFNTKTIYVAGEEASGGPFMVPSFGPYMPCCIPALHRDYGDIQVVRNWDGVS
jgi:hypothetical protein